MRVHSCALRLLDSIEHCKSLFPSSTGTSYSAPAPNDVKVRALAIYGVAFAFEDDAEVSEHQWTRRSRGVKPKDIAAMEFRVMQLYYGEGQGSMLPSAVRL